MRREGQPNSNRSHWPPMAPHGIYRCAGRRRLGGDRLPRRRGLDRLAAMIGEPWTPGRPSPTWPRGSQTRTSSTRAWPRGLSAQDKFDVAATTARGRRPARRCRSRPSGSTTTRTTDGAVADRHALRHGPGSGRRPSGALLGDADWRIERGAPCLGEHNEAVFGDLLGLAPAEVAALREEGVMTSALSGVRVVELANERIAFAGKLLADLGADVVLVEPPGGDPARRYRRSSTTSRAPSAASGGGTTTPASAASCSTWTQAQDQARFRRWSRAPTSCSKSNRSGGSPRLGLDYDDLRRSARTSSSCQ